MGHALCLYCREDRLLYGSYVQQPSRGEVPDRVWALGQPIPGAIPGLPSDPAVALALQPPLQPPPVATAESGKKPGGGQQQPGGSGGGEGGSEGSTGWRVWPYQLVVLKMRNGQADGRPLLLERRAAQVQVQSF